MIRKHKLLFLYPLYVLMLVAVFSFVRSPKAQAFDGRICKWEGGTAKLECRRKNKVGSAWDLAAQYEGAITNIISGPIAGNFLGKQVTDALTTDFNGIGPKVCGTTFICNDYYLDPAASLAAGYPIFYGNNEYLHFTDYTNRPELITISSGKTKLSAPGSKVAIAINYASEVTKDPDVESGKPRCSIKGPTDCYNNVTKSIYTTSDPNAAKLKEMSSSFSSLATAQSNSSSTNCDAGALDFIICPIQQLIIQGINAFIGPPSSTNPEGGIFIQLLTVKSNMYAPTNNSGGPSDLAQSVSRIVGLANVIYAIIFLLIIFANGLSISIDSYTLKKMIPRLVAAVIFTQFAYFIVGAMIDIGNVLGQGIPELLKGLGGIDKYTERLATLFAVVMVAGGGPLGILLMLIIGLLALIAFVIGFIVLAFRNVILYVLIITAPLAFAAWVLPGTQKLFKLWWSNLIKLVMMFPMIVGMLYLSLVVSGIIQSSGAGFTEKIIAMILPIFALFMLPKTLKWSGSLMAATGGAVGGFLGAQAKKQTVGRAKDAYSKDGGAKDKFLASDLGAKFGGLTAKSRLQNQAGALGKIEKVNSGYASAAKLQLGRTYDKIDADSTLTDPQKEIKKQEAFDKTMGALGRDSRAKATVIAGLAKSGDRKTVAYARSSGAISESEWSTMASQNFDSFDSMADMRSTHTSATTVTDPTKTRTNSLTGAVETNLTGDHAFVAGLSADAFTKGNRGSQKAWAEAGAFDYMSHQQIKLLSDQGVRSKLTSDALGKLRDHKIALQGLGVRTHEQQERLDSLNWII